MEVILMQNVANLGNIGDNVKVKPGYGRNYLLPSGKAALATAANLKKFEERSAEFEKAAPQEHQEFLEYLHIPKDEIVKIREGSRRDRH